MGVVLKAILPTRFYSLRCLWFLNTPASSRQFTFAHLHTYIYYPFAHASIHSSDLPTCLFWYVYISHNGQFGLQYLSKFVGEKSFVALSVSLNVHFLLSCVWLVLIRVVNCVVIGRGKFPSKNTTIIWQKWWYYSRTKQKLHVSAYIGHHQVFTTSLLKSLI